MSVPAEEFECQCNINLRLDCKTVLFVRVSAGIGSGVPSISDYSHLEVQIVVQVVLEGQPVV